LTHAPGGMVRRRGILGWGGDFTAATDAKYRIRANAILQRSKHETLPRRQ
jgi:hypothetical protein